MRADSFQTLREWLALHPSEAAAAALQDIELAYLDTLRVERFVLRRRIPTSQRLLELQLVEKRLREYRAVHAKVSDRSARRWIARSLGLPVSRVRGYLEHLRAEGRRSVRDESSTLSAAESLTSAPALGESRDAKQESA